MSAAWLVAVDEWRLTWRNRVAMLGMVMLIGLSMVAALTSIAQRDASEALRARYQSYADRQFDSQPARHPHRMVHYGHFLFRPVPALAAFDPGIEAFTGNAIFLEGHRQNSANFSDARQSSLLVRFGQMTPAFVLQALVPLLLVFIGFSAIAREREHGTFQLLLAHGVSPGTLVAGKLLALGGIAALLFAPGLLVVLWLAIYRGAEALPTLTLLAGYALYLAVWTLLVVLASSLAKRSRTALATLLGAWALTVILLPRVATDLALMVNPPLTRVETDIAIAEDLRRMGDSHNPDDPYFNAFRKQVLRQYGVAKVEDLPVNYRGLLAVEGEKLTSGLFDEYAQRLFEAQARQSNTARAIGISSPSIALRWLSMSASGTGPEEQRNFLTQAESYRYAIVQQLNQLQADAITYVDDGNRNSDPDAGRRVRIDPENWQNVPDFRYVEEDADHRIQAAWPELAMLLFWLATLGVGILLSARRLREVA